MENDPKGGGPNAGDSISRLEKIEGFSATVAKSNGDSSKSLTACCFGENFVHAREWCLEKLSRAA